MQSCNYCESLITKNTIWRSYLIQNASRLKHISLRYEILIDVSLVLKTLYRLFFSFYLWPSFGFEMFILGFNTSIPEVITPGYKYNSIWFCMKEITLFFIQFRVMCHGVTNANRFFFSFVILFSHPSNDSLLSFLRWE